MIVPKEIKALIDKAARLREQEKACEKERIEIESEIFKVFNDSDVIPLCVRLDGHIYSGVTRRNPRFQYDQEILADLAVKMPSRLFNTIFETQYKAKNNIAKTKLLISRTAPGYRNDLTEAVKVKESRTYIVYKPL
jgi:hypothetical protein